jgi:two-component system OmpR family response regulator
MTSATPVVMMRTDITPSPEKRVLIVEHDEATTDTYARMLRLDGYQVRIALTAEAGLRDVETIRPDAILVDLRMPDIDGLEFLRRLRDRDETRHTPVAIVTGDYFFDDAISGPLRALGARVCFKPIWLDDLGTIVRDLLNIDAPS